MLMIVHETVRFFSRGFTVYTHAAYCRYRTRGGLGLGGPLVGNGLSLKLIRSHALGILA